MSEGISPPQYICKLNAWYESYEISCHIPSQGLSNHLYVTIYMISGYYVLSFTEDVSLVHPYDIGSSLLA